MPYTGGVDTDKTVAGKSSFSSVPNIGSNAADGINVSSSTFTNLLGSTSADSDEQTGFAAGLSVFPDGKNPVSSAVLKLNGQERFSERTGRYFNTIQPYQHHTNGPAPGINVYSFALSPEEHQPSGTCNFSRIDKAVLSLTLTTNTVQDEDSTSTAAKVKIFATNYNVLRIMSGMGGLAYAN